MPHIQQPLQPMVGRKPLLREDSLELLIEFPDNSFICSSLHAYTVTFGAANVIARRLVHPRPRSLLIAKRHFMSNVGKGSETRICHATGSSQSQQSSTKSNFCFPQ